MITIYLVKAIYSEYENNEIKKYNGEKVLYAELSKVNAEKDIKRYTKETEQERTEWFKTHTYGMFPSEYIIEEVRLY